VVSSRTEGTASIRRRPREWARHQQDPPKSTVHRWKAYVRQTLAKGSSRFCRYAGRGRRDREVPSMKQEARPDKAGTGPVLVVDDERHSRELVAIALNGAGLEVVQATSGQQALDLLAVGTFGAVVLDNHMPGFTGLEVLRVLRSRRETVTLPVVLLTGDDSTA